MHKSCNTVVFFFVSYFRMWQSFVCIYFRDGRWARACDSSTGGNEHVCPLSLSSSSLLCCGDTDRGTTTVVAMTAAAAAANYVRCVVCNIYDRNQWKNIINLFRFNIRVCICE